MQNVLPFFFWYIYSEFFGTSIVLNIISKMITTYVVLLTILHDTQDQCASHFMGWYVGAHCSSWTFNSKLVTYFSPQALQWDQKSNQLWFSNHKSAQEIRVAICPSNLARKFVSFSQPASQLVRHFPRVNHSTEAETLGMKNSQNINILMADLDQQHVVQFPWER